MEDKVATMKAMGILSSDDALIKLLTSNNGDIERAIDEFYRIPKPSIGIKRVKQTPEVFVIDSDEDDKIDHVMPVSAEAQKHKPSIPGFFSSVKKDTPQQVGPLYFVGRRTVMGYTITKGRAIRSQCIAITLEGVSADGTSGPPKNKKQKTSSSSGSGGWGNKNVGKPGKKDKHAGVKLLFNTFASSSRKNKVNSPPEEGEFTGRLPALVCDFLVPLINAQLITVRGHVAYDIGPINTFVDVPLSLQVYITSAFLDISTPGSPAYQRFGALIEKANDCLLWLQEGEGALKLLRQQREKDKDVLKAKLASSSSSTSDPGTGKKTAAVTGSSSNADAAAASGGMVEGEEGLGNEQVDEELQQLVDGATSSVASSSSSSSSSLAAEELPCAPQPTLMREGLEMRRYQLQALGWMQQRERGDAAHRKREEEEDPGGGVKKSANTTPAAAFQGGKVALVVPHDGLLQVKQPPEAVAAAVSISGSSQEGNDADAAKAGDKTAGVWQQLMAVAPSSPSSLATGEEEEEEEEDTTIQEIRTRLEGRSHRIQGGGAAGGLVDTDDNKNENFENSVSPSGALPFYWNVYSQSIQRSPPPKHTSAMGGILADDMGLGKTVMATSLIAADYMADAAADANAGNNCDGGRVDVLPAYEAVSGSKRQKKLTSKRKTVSSKKSRRKMVVESSDDEEDDEHEDEEENEQEEVEAGGQNAVGCLRRMGGHKVNGFTFAPLSPTRGVTSDAQAQKRQQQQQLPVRFQSAVPRQTLVVAPMSLLAQWCEEIVTKTQPGALRVAMYYGTDREREMALKEADVVVTSYGVLSSEARQWGMQQQQSSALGSKLAELHAKMATAGTSGEKERAERAVVALRPGLLQVCWHRVILDEAHVIKNAQTEAAQACCLLHSVKRWCLTGTPLQNTVDDVFSLVKFLRHEPWREYRFFRKVITDPYSSRDKDSGNSKKVQQEQSEEARRAMGVLRRLLGEVLLRRTKTMRDKDGTPIVQLPSRNVHIHHVELHAEEREFYAALLRRSRAIFNRFEAIARGGNNDSGSGGIGNEEEGGRGGGDDEERDVMQRLQRLGQRDPHKALRNRYTALFTLLLRMRMAVDHPLLVIKGGSQQGGVDGAGVIDDSVVVASGSTSGPVTNRSHRGVRVVAAFGGGNERGSAAASAAADDVDLADLAGAQFLNSLMDKLMASRHKRTTKVNNSSNGSSSSSCSGGDGQGRSSSSSPQKLSSGGGKEEDAFLTSLRETLLAASTGTGDGGGDAVGEFECPICMEPISLEDRSVTSCGHIFCSACADTIWTSHTTYHGRRSANPFALGPATEDVCPKAKCPHCNLLITRREVYSLKRLAAAEEGGGGSEEEGKDEETGGTAASSSSSSGSGSGSGSGSQSSVAAKSPSDVVAVTAGDVKQESSSPQAAVSLATAQPNWRHWGDNRIASSSSSSSSLLRGWLDGRGGTVADGDDDDDSFAGEGAFMTSSKIEAILQRLLWVLQGGHDDDNDHDSIKSSKSKQLPGEKVVIFSQWTSMLDILQKALSLASTTAANNGTPILARRLDGSMSQAQRSKNVSAFNEDPSIRVLLLSLKAGGVGLNLTTASTAMMVDPWWNPTTEDQAIDRIHRLGQVRPVNVYRFVCTDTVEERLLALQEKKRGMAQQALGGSTDQGAQAKLSLDDLRSFFL